MHFGYENGIFVWQQFVLQSVKISGSFDEMTVALSLKSKCKMPQEELWTQPYPLK